MVSQLLKDIVEKAGEKPNLTTNSAAYDRLPRYDKTTFPFFVSDPLCLSSSSSSAIHFSDYSFLVHHPVHRDLLAHAMASDFTVAWQYSQREQLFFHYASNSLPIKLLFCHT
jgi:hypothetical protein